MTADGFLNQKRRHPIALATAISINLAGVTALMLVNMGVPIEPPRVFETIKPTLDPPPPEPIERQIERRKTVVPPKPFNPDPAVESDRIDDRLSTTGTTEFPPAGGATTEGTGITVAPKAAPTPLPVLTEAVPLAAAARDFQPPYPSQLLRTGVEGKVVVRVLIGTDGRVRQVAILSADDPLFADATERQALRKWRFKPATRDGTPIETWKQLAVRFEIRS